MVSKTRHKNIAGSICWMEFPFTIMGYSGKSQKADKLISG